MDTNKTKKRAPLRRAQRFAKEAPVVAGKLAVMTIVLMVVGMLFGMIQGVEILWLRVGLTGLAVAFVLMYYFGEGANKGAADTGSSRQYARHEKAGLALTAADDAACYHPLKALLGSMMVFAVPFVLAVIVALCAEPYTYTLQDLPTWLTGSYAAREDVMGPLGAYTQGTGLGIVDMMRVVVRLFVLLFVNFFSDPQRMSQMIDWCAPAFMLSYPLAYTLGYLRGPAEHAKMEKMNRKAKKVAVRKQQKSNLTRELLGQSNVPHYGHQREKDKPKKKELI